MMAVSIVWELGYLIALPAVVLGVGGAYLDKYLQTSPTFLLTGFVLALVLSTLGVWRMIKRVFEEEKREGMK
jgi:F0F1-type ATP synthase assembly protein I